MRHGKHGHRNELMILLDELLRQDGINRDEYKQLSTMLADSLHDIEWILNRIAKKTNLKNDDVIESDNKEMMEQSLKKKLLKILLTMFFS